MIKKIIAIIVGFTVIFAYCETFEDYKRQFIQKAENEGVSSVLLDQLIQITLYEKAIVQDKNQSEFKKFLWDYLDSAVSNKRVITGRSKFQANRYLLEKITQQTGVAPQIIVAIWGMESNYGGYTGKVPVMASMMTLAYEGRRRSFFEGELMTALRLVERGDISRFDVRGSWAGGLGMTQFIPSSYQRYAIDFDGDGRRDLWHVPDALASTANYLSAMGWQENYRWGREVKLPAGFDYLQANDRKNIKILDSWSSMGVSSVDGSALPDAHITARLFVPAGQFGPKFLLYSNFDVIKRYNNSDAYALGVSLLSEKIKGTYRVAASWPTNAKKLTKNDIKIVQQALNAYGFNAGSVDGILGNGTRRALQAYQAAHGQVADGFLSVELFRQLVTDY